MAASPIIIPYGPRRVFVPYHATTKRWSVVVAHRRCGKTVAKVNRLIRSALTCPLPDPRAAYIAPLFKQAKDVAWTYLKRFSASIPGSDPNESELRVDFPNGGRVRLYGADNPDGMRGIYLDDCVLDEFGDMRPSLLPEVIRPALSDRRGSLSIGGTPKGRNGFYDIWQMAQDDPDWFTLMLRASETGLISEEELASARKLMSEDQYQQEYECSFDAAIPGAYWAKEISRAEREGRICAVAYDPSQPVHTVWDIGVRDATAIWFFQPLFGGLNVIDYYEASGVGLEHYAEALKDKPYQYGYAYVPHDGMAREWGSGKTRVEQMMVHGFKPHPIPHNSLIDGIHAARMTLPLARFDKERCKRGLEALVHYHAEYDEDRKVLKPTPEHDWSSHAADAWRYLSLAWRETRKGEPPKPKPRFWDDKPTMDELWASHGKHRAGASRI